MFEQRNSKVLCGHIHVALKNEDDMQRQIILEIQNQSIKILLFKIYY